MDEIPTLREMDYRNLFITCSTLDLDKEKREVSKPSTDTQTVTTDGFDWDEDFEKAYGIK